MDTLRILTLALLAGTASAGCVWYVWGVAENITVLRNGPPTDDGDDSTEDEPDDDTAEPDANAEVARET